MTNGKKEGQHSIIKDTIANESLLKITKEVAIKFIEMGRVTPATFDETFKNIHKTVSETVKKIE